MREILLGWRAKLIAAVLVLTMSAFYFSTGTLQSTAWLHREQKISAGIDVGVIDFLFFNSPDSVAAPRMQLTPTRYFKNGVRRPTDGPLGDNVRDEKFNDTVSFNIIYGYNAGDVDINVKLLCDGPVTPDQSIFYVFIPVGDVPTNITNTRTFRQYLDTALGAGADAADYATRKAAIDALNTANFAKIQNIVINKDQSANLCYLIAWSEHEDTAEWGDDLPNNNILYVSKTCTLKLTAASIQKV